MALELEAGAEVAGRYRIVRELARGGMGAVYIATDQKFDARVAIKVAGGAGISDTAGIKARFKREAKLANLLGRTPGCVRVFDWGEVEPNGRLFLAMDLVADAKELDLRSGPLVERLRRLIEAAKIVSGAHGLGVIHRDLKPANFLIAKDGSVHLTDFGIAKNLAEPDDEASKDPALGMGLTVTGMAMGTPYYMSPEQFEDAKSVDGRGDIYALGVMLFLAMTGRLPYTGDNASQVLSTQLKVRYEGRRPPRVHDHHPGVPPVLDAICSKAMALDPAQRYPSVNEFVAALERVDWEALARIPDTAPAKPTGRKLGPSASSNEPTISEPGPAPDLRDMRTELDTTRTGADRLRSPADAPPPPGPTCASCGGPQEKEYCKSCGLHKADADALARKQTKRHQERAAATMSTAPVPPPPPIRREVGAGIQHESGIQIPKSVWFVIGILICVAIGVRMVPAPQPGRKVEPRPDDPTTTGTTTAAPAGRALPLEDAIEQMGQPTYDLAVALHAAWRAAAAAKPDLAEGDPKALGLSPAQVDRLPIDFFDDQTSCTRDDKGAPVTRVMTQTRITLVFTGETPPVARR